MPGGPGPIPNQQVLTPEQQAAVLLQQQSQAGRGTTQPLAAGNAPDLLGNAWASLNDLGASIAANAATVIAGAASGGGAGATIGATIGSVIPGVGTAVGGVIGLIIGAIGGAALAEGVASGGTFGQPQGGGSPAATGPNTPLSTDPTVNYVDTTHAKQVLDDPTGNQPSTPTGTATPPTTVTEAQAEAVGASPAAQVEQAQEAAAALRLSQQVASGNESIAESAISGASAVSGIHAQTAGRGLRVGSGSPLLQESTAAYNISAQREQLQGAASSGANAGALAELAGIRSYEAGILQAGQGAANTQANNWLTAFEGVMNTASQLVTRFWNPSSGGQPASTGSSLWGGWVPGT